MIKKIVLGGIVAALYIVLSLAIAPLSYGQIQFRFGEILMVLPFINKKYSISLIVGCLIVNLFSPLGLVDVLFGTISTALMCFVITKAKNIYSVPFIAAGITGLMIGLELYFIFNIPLWISFFTVGLGELVVVFIGVLLFKAIAQNKYIYTLLKSG